MINEERDSLLEKYSSRRRELRERKEEDGIRLRLTSCRLTKEDAESLQLFYDEWETYSNKEVAKARQKARSSGKRRPGALHGGRGRATIMACASYKLKPSK